MLQYLIIYLIAGILWYLVGTDPRDMWLMFTGILMAHINVWIINNV